jgi:hypothetical protein
MSLSCGSEVLTAGFKEGLYMFDTIPVFHESSLEELQLMEASLITQSLVPVHQGCKNELFVGSMVM